MQAIIQVLTRHATSFKDSTLMEVIHAEGEADEEVVRVAVLRGAVAILSNDSDMIFFHTRKTTATHCSALSVEQRDSNAAPPSSCMEPVDIPLLPFASFHFSGDGRRLVMEALVQRKLVARATGVRSEVGEVPPLSVFLLPPDMASLSTISLELIFIFVNLSV
jgi:hypothetical protein